MILPALVNAILCFIASYFIFCYPLSFGLKRNAANFIAAVIAVLVSIAAYILTSNSEKRKIGRKKDTIAFDQRMSTLYACTDDEIQSLFLSVLFKMNICAEVRGRHMLLNNGNAVFAALYPEQMSANELAPIIREYKTPASTLSVISSSFSAEAVLFARSLNVKLIDGKEFYEFLKNGGNLAPARQESKSRVQKAAFFPLAFKVRPKRLFLFAAMLGAFSYFTFFPLYYIIGSAFFALYGLIALVFGKTTPNKKNANMLENVLKDKIAA